MSFAEYLKAETTLPQPGHIVMLSPVLDGTLSNPDAKTYERIDPMLGIEGSKYFIKLWVANYLLRTIEYRRLTVT